jgi:hypothetical protein
MSASTRTLAVAALMLAAMLPGRAGAQVIRCENLVFTAERINCYYYRAAMAPGPSCLFFCPPAPQPIKRTRHRRVRR